MAWGNPLMLSLMNARSYSSPFPYFYAAEVFSPEVHKALLDWFNSESAWRLVQADFYEQYEIKLRSASLPPAVAFLTSTPFLTRLQSEAATLFGTTFLDRIETVAHKLTPGQRIGIHNDYLPGHETHRLLIQVNETEEPDSGGLLMLFRSSNARDVSKILQPKANSAIGFAINPHSHHAVSRQHRGDRFTLVCSFFERPGSGTKSQ